MNTIELVGSLVEPPELKYSTTGLPILELTMAGQSERIWYQRVTVFGPQAEDLAETPVGTILHMVGRLDYQTWEKDGAKRSAVKVIAYSIAPTDGETSPDGKGQPVLQDAVNVVTLAGNLTKDPESRELETGSVTNAGVAINEGKGDQKRAHFIDLTRWNAGIPGSKGDRIIATGELRNRSFEDREGRRQYRTEVHITRVSSAGKGPVRPQEARTSAPADRLDIDAEDERLPF